MTFEAGTCWFELFTRIDNERIIERRRPPTWIHVSIIFWTRKQRWNLALLFTTRRLILIWFTWTFGDQQDSITWRSSAIYLYCWWFPYALLGMQYEMKVWNIYCSLSGRSWWRSKQAERSKCSNLIILGSTREISSCDLVRTIVLICTSQLENRLG